jgi:hypothetical protein
MDNIRQGKADFRCRDENPLRLFAFASIHKPEISDCARGMGKIFPQGEVHIILMGEERNAGNRRGKGKKKP